MSTTTMTKNELLAVAKTLGIKGRHDLSVEDLRTAVAQKQAIVEAAPTKNLVKNTNIPWRRKFYFLDIDTYIASSEVLKKEASQVQLMLKYMYDAGITSLDDAAQGMTIANEAIAKGYIKTKIEGHVLFAYYVRRMEQYGLTFAGYDVG